VALISDEYVAKAGSIEQHLPGERSWCVPRR
jgi:hypothetical protein